jgi:hypothetical protein
MQDALVIEHNHLAGGQPQPDLAGQSESVSL